MVDRSLKRQAAEILRRAEETGTERNFFFVTTFKSYMFQLEMLDKLEASINELGTLVTKEYVKGRENIYTNPAIDKYNSTADSAKKAVSTLIKIIKSFETDDKDGEDPLLEMINGDSE